MPQSKVSITLDLSKEEASDLFAIFSSYLVFKGTATETVVADVMFELQGHVDIGRVAKTFKHLEARMSDFALMPRGDRHA